jgi:gp16 family phage-associated protein
VTISEWARQHGFKPAIVASLLCGRTRGCWGEAHEAAVMLGLQPAPAEDEVHPLATSSTGRRMQFAPRASEEGVRMI